MDLAADMTEKIKSAVKAKLIELGTYVDDELPEYIMVMVANKRSQSQMTDDLKIFLGAHTKKFTKWLNAILMKVQAVTVDGPDSKITPKPDEAKQTKKKTNDDGQTAKKRKTTDHAEPKAKKKKTKQAGALIKKVKTKATVKPVEKQPTPVNTVSCAAAGEKTSVDKQPIKEPVVPEVKFVDSFGDGDLGISLDVDDKDSFLEKELAEIASEVETERAQAPTEARYRSPLKRDVQVVSKPDRDSQLDRVSLPKSGDLSEDSTTGTAQRPISKKSNVVERRVVNLRQESLKTKVEVTVTSNNRISEYKSRSGPSSTVGLVVSREETDEGYDPRNPMIGNVASVVRVSQRRIFPKDKQPPRNLLMKAVAEAQQSVKPRNAAPSSVVAPPEPVATKTELRDEIAKIKEQVRKRQIPISGATKEATPPPTGGKDHSDSGSESAEEYSTPLPAAVRNTYKPTPLRRAVKYAESDDVTPSDVIASDVRKQKAEPQPPASQPEPSDQVCSVLHSKSSGGNVNDRFRGVSSPSFIVTLEGAGLSSKMSDYDEINEDMDIIGSSTGQCDVDYMDTMDDAEEEEEMETNIDKKLERCRYWPACKMADECIFHHPTFQCKAFPKCKFGDKCLYIHPNCKFDATCSRPDCPFTHASKRGNVMGFFSGGIAKAAPVAASSTQCRFYPNCTNPSCAFYHPNVCRFGDFCARLDCRFSHPSSVSSSKFKWTSATSAPSARVSAAATPGITFALHTKTAPLN